MAIPARIAAAAPPYPEPVAARLARIMPPGRAPLALFTTLARDARLFERFFAGGLLDRGHLTLRQREIVIDRTTARCHAEYEWGVHAAFFAARVGLTDAQLHSLARGAADDPCWSAEEALLIRLCDELHTTADVSEGLWTELRRHHAEGAMLELLMLAGTYHTVSYLANALRLPLEEYAVPFPGSDAQAAA
jgi:hypothetical protein